VGLLVLIGGGKLGGGIGVFALLFPPSSSVSFVIAHNVIGWRGSCADGTALSAIDECKTCNPSSPPP